MKSLFFDEFINNQILAIESEEFFLILLLKVNNNSDAMCI